jgi:hypothetical protein
MGIHTNHLLQHGMPQESLLAHTPGKGVAYFSAAFAPRKTGNIYFLKLRLWDKAHKLNGFSQKGMAKSQGAR